MRSAAIAEAASFSSRVAASDRRDEQVARAVIRNVLPMPRRGHIDDGYVGRKSRLSSFEIARTTGDRRCAADDITPDEDDEVITLSAIGPPVRYPS
jgi:hypothetical protein